jgi:predicted small lipoprotein YifL
MHSTRFLMKRLFAAMTAALMVLALAGPTLAAQPAAPGQSKLQCFDGTTDGGFGGICTLTGNGAKGPATLDNTDTNTAGDYAGVYVDNTTLFGQPLGKVTQLSYNYTGTTVPTPGDLSLNLPISVGGYAYIDAFYCPGVAGAVNVITDVTCGIWFNGSEYANWTAFVAAFPTASVSADALPFIIAERVPAEGPAMWTVSNVKLGKAGK